MFLLAGILWIALGSIPLIRAVKRRSQPGSRGRFVRAAVVLGLDLLILVAVNVFFGIATEFWWFEASGFGQRFWTEYTVRIVLFLVGAAIGAAIFGPALRAIVPAGETLIRRIVTAAGSLTGAIVLGLIANGLWQPILLFINRMPAGTADPIFGLDVSFYLFSLPLAQAVRARLISALVVYLIALAIAITISRPEMREGAGPVALLARSRRARRQAMGTGGVLLLLLSVGNLLAIPELMYSGQGAVTGVGWIEANVLVPANIVAAVVWLLAAVILFWGTINEGAVFRLLAIRTVEHAPEEELTPEQGATSGEESGRQEADAVSAEPVREVRLTSRSWVAPVIVVAGLFLVTSVVPGLIRGLVLDPNEITLEAPYIPHHVRFTRNAYAINSENVAETEYTAGRNVTREVLEANEPTLDNIRLWDPRALLSNLEQQQEIRLYYEFHDVDIDRYELNGETRQMMLSVRELEKSRLAEASQTWVSRHFKYTHGHGLVALPVHEFLPQGRPDLVVRNIPPEPNDPRFEVRQPEVYYGERTDDHVYVRTTQQEFDYPSGDQNVYTDYAGDGGVPIGGLIRRLAYAWRIDGYRQLFSGYFTGDSRIMFRRHIVDRAATVAPFLRYDRDPYPVLTEDGRIVYIIDAYTTSRNYPYAKPYSGMLDDFRGVNYVRNSVKVVVDAYDGSVDFYVVTPDDPLIGAFTRIFPELFSPLEEMPADLKEHIRYPADLLTVQAELYSVYHMTDTQVFYQREDVWEFATERYRASFQSVEPYYVMLQYPQEEQPEFILMMPFTPANKNVVNAWMAGRSDYEQYGQLTVYTLPKGVEVLGPRQIEARIDQNTEMSQALSLWSQRGSEVIRGNLLAIPLFANGELYLLYVEPIFLQAEDAALPEIKRIVLADQDRVVWDPEFNTAVDRLLGRLPSTPGGVARTAPDVPGPDEEPEAAAGEPTEGEGEPADVAAESAGQPEPSPDQPAPPELPAGEAAQRAREALRDYRNAIADGRYARAGEALERLEQLLGGLSENQ